MKDQPAVDVIIPTYNGMPWLRATIDSVLSQTHRNLKLYVVDDGSKDDTAKYVKSLKDKRVTYIKKANGGQSTARNLGIKKSDSPFIALLDSDDIWYPEKLEKQMAIMAKKPDVGMVYGHHYLIDENDIIQGNLRHSFRGNIFDKLCTGNYIAGSASMVLIRRDVINDVGLFRENFLIGEDWEMWLRIAEKYEIDFVPEIIAALRQRSDGMQTNHKKMADGLMSNYEFMKKELNLTIAQKHALASYSLFHAATAYRAVGMRKEARRAFLKLFREYPRAAFNWQDWKPHFGIGIFSRVIFGNPVFDVIGRVIGRIIRIFKNIIRLPLRALLYIYRKRPV